MKFTQQEIISLISICIGTFLIIMDTNIVNIIIPDLRHQLNITIPQASWVVNSYVLAFASLLLISARLSKRAGAKNVYIAGISIFMIGSLLCGLSGSYGTLVISRVVQGFGAALFAPIATKLLSSTIKGSQKRAVAFGIWSGTSGMGFAFSPMVGGFLNELWGWQSIFFINIPFSLLVILTGILAIGKIDKEKSSMYMKEQIAVVLLIFTFVFIAHEYKSILESPLFPTIWITVLLAVGFIYARKFKQNQTHVVSRPMFSGSNTGSLINGFTYNFSIYGIMYFLSIYFQESLHLSSLETGIKFLPLTISAMLISSFISPFLVAKLGTTVTQQLCLAAIIAGSSLLLIHFGIAPVPGMVTVSFIILGFSGAIAPVLMNAAFSSTKEIYHNEISSLVNLARQMGSISGVVIVSILLDIFINVMAFIFFLPVTMLIAFIAYKYTAWNQKSETGSLDCDEVASSCISKS